MIRLHQALLIALLLIFTPISGASDAEQPLWIDVRSTVEFQLGHLQGAEHIPYDEVVTTLASMDISKDREIKLYCMSGGRAGKAQTALQAAGYTQVENVGGLDDARAMAEQAQP